MSDLNGDIHALSGAYAVDALDDLERARFARHLAECSECQAEVDSLREAAAMLPELTAMTPSDALRQRVLAQISTVRPLAPVVTPQPAPATRSSRPGRPWLRGLVAAAAVVATLGAGGVVWDQLGNDSSDSPAPVADRVLRAPDAEKVTQKLRNGAEVSIVRSKSMNMAVLVAHDMPAPPSGKVYELWLQDAEKGMIPAGLVPDGDNGLVLLSGNAADAIGAGITLEPAGGSHVPTTPTVADFAFENA